MLTLLVAGEQQFVVVTHDRISEATTEYFSLTNDLIAVLSFSSKANSLPPLAQEALSGAS